MACDAQKARPFSKIGKREAARSTAACFVAVGILHSKSRPPESQALRALCALGRTAWRKSLRKRLTSDVREIVSHVKALDARVRVSRVFDLVDARLSDQHKSQNHPFVCLEDLRNELRCCLTPLDRRAAVLLHPREPSDARPAYVVVVAAERLRFCSVEATPRMLKKTPVFEGGVCGYSAYVVEHI